MTVDKPLQAQNTWADGTNGLPLETVLAIGCRGAEGKNSVATAFEPIWSEFTNLATGTKTANDVGMAYWVGLTNNTPDNAGYYTTDGLVSLANGKCRGWANLMVDVCRAQGIVANVYGINPKLPARPTTIGAPRGYLFKDRAAQKNSNPWKNFNDHAVVALSPNAAIYDPSYGAWYSSIQSWADNNVLRLIGTIESTEHQPGDVDYTIGLMA